MNIFASIIAYFWPGKHTKKAGRALEAKRTKTGTKPSAASKRFSEPRQAKPAAPGDDYGDPEQTLIFPPPRKLSPEDLETLKRQKKEVEAFKTFFPEIAEWISPIGLGDPAYHPNAFVLKPGYDTEAFTGFINGCWDAIIRTLGTKEGHIDAYMRIKPTNGNRQKVWISDVAIWCYLKWKFLPMVTEVDPVRETFLILNQAGWGTFRITQAAIKGKTPKEVVSEYWRLAREEAV